jgi:foldase protein PrsA
MGLPLDARAQKRNETAAGELAQQLLARCRAGEAFEPLMREYSEDGGSAASGVAYPVTPEAQFVEPFKDLALRLKPGECGMVKSQFGWHVMKRVR